MSRTITQIRPTSPMSNIPTMIPCVMTHLPSSCLVHLVDLVCFVYLVDLVHLVSLVGLGYLVCQVHRISLVQPNKPNNFLLTLANRISRYPASRMPNLK